MNTMRSRLCGSASALALCLIAAGCGLFPGAPRDEEPVYQPLWAVARVGDVYDIYSVVPPQGPLSGGNTAQLQGVFPNPADLGELIAAAAIYKVYFGNNMAQYDLGVVPFMTASTIDVIVPPGDALGFVDVIFRDVTTLRDAAALYDGYEYIDDFAIISVDPDRGPMSGGQQVTVNGRFPIAAPMNSVAEADAAYRVYFDNRPAAFDGSVSPVITSTAMFVITPPGVPPNAPGLVDVRVETVVPPSETPQFRELPQGYEYFDDFAIISVDPDRGPMAGGQQVTVNGLFPVAAPINTVAEAYGAYRVYFDARPAGFDSSFTPVITSTTMYVITPPGVPPNAPGLVDVSVATVVPPSESPQFRVLPLGYEYVDFRLEDVVPDIGWIFGDEPVKLEGFFPVTSAFSQSLLGNVAGAYQYYRVYFDGRFAPFDTTVLTPVITSTAMYVRSPFGDDVEIVDVEIIAGDNGDFVTNPSIAQLEQAYRYYAMYLERAVPNQGPLAGGNLVRLEGFLPGLQSITDISAAYAEYTVLFGGNRADFADMTPDPCFVPSQIISIASRIYTTGHMYVVAPPGATVGFVDVTIIDHPTNPARTPDLPTTAVNGYEYLGVGGIARWDTAVVAPNPVGKLDRGELLVHIEGVGEVTNRGGTGPAFIVPQGGDPANPNHRILLEEISYSEDGGDFTWEGTNVDPIPRILNPGGADELLVDGHAAVFIDAEFGEIFGDNPTDLSDGTIIQGQALEGRHFIIDTIPPRLRVSPFTGYLRGDNFVNPDIDGNWTGLDVDSVGPFPPQVNPHPYPAPPPGSANMFYDAPFDGHWMFRPANAETMAQVFFNVSSLTNNFADSNPDAAGVPTAPLRFNLTVVFEDVDIYTMLNRLPGPNDTNLFGGGTDRPVAGFTPDLNTTRLGLRRDDAVGPHNESLILWDFLPTPFALPEFANVTVQYTIPAGSPVAVGGNTALSGNLAPAPIWMQGTYIVGDLASPADPPFSPGVQLTGPRNLLSVVFRAVDRAGDYRRQSNEKPGFIKLYTRDDFDVDEGYAINQQPEMGPLNMWWLRTTATRLTSTVPPSGDIRAPLFSWVNTGVPDPGAYPDTADGDGSQRLYSYAIYRTSPALGTRDEQRDGPYDIVVPWSGWTNLSALTAADVQALIAANVTDNIFEGVWFLLVVMSCDEAGNLELWPEDQLLIPAGVNTIDRVQQPGDEERNWERWYVPPSAEAVDTRIEPFYWHDYNVAPAPPPLVFDGLHDPNVEPSFGDAEVIPYPPLVAFQPNAGVFFQQVAAQFTMLALTDADGARLGIDWRLVENGVEVLANQIPPASVIGGTAFVSFFSNNGTPPYLGVNSRQPTYYTFQARAFVDADNDGLLDSNEIYDTSPAAVQFVIVDNVPQFIQNRRAEDTQPIQEMDRP